MTDTQAEAPPAVNGTAPQGQPAGQEPAAAPCEDCATSGERALAVVAGLFGLFIVGLAIDMFTGGRLSKLLAGTRAEAE
jgi:hypothetical protein